MQSVFEAPNNSVPEFETEFLRDFVNENIQRENLAFFPNMVPDLPAKTSISRQYPHTFRKGGSLEVEILIEPQTLFVLLANVVRRGGNDEASSSIRNLFK